MGKPGVMRAMGIWDLMLTDRLPATLYIAI